MKTGAYAETALITGSNNGIGLALTRKLLAEGWQVIAMVRSDFAEEDGSLQHAIRDGKLRVYKADLTAFSQLKHALNKIKEKETHIDVLFNNAGGSLSGIFYSKQGRELHFELQTVAPYIIFMELKELLQKGSRKTVVNTSTNAFASLKAFRADALEQPESFKKLFGPYAATKLALSLWTHALAPLAAPDGIVIRSADPGGNNTIRKGNSTGLPFYIRPIMKLFFASPDKGASLLYDAAVGHHGGLSGVYVTKGKVAKLKFVEQAPLVLEKVQAIYEREFMKLGS